MRYSYSIFKEAAGIYYEDRFVPLIESVLNIIASVILVKLIGLPGVFIGTIVSGLALWCYSYPKFVYKKLFSRNYKNYAIETISYILLFVFIATTTYGISTMIVFKNIFLKLVINAIICVIIPCLINIIVFYRTDNFKYYKKLLLKR